VSPRDARPQGGANNLVLVGFSTSGKTTVGRILARRLRLRFLDTDKYIEQTEGRTIPEIFAQDGEPAFREMEAKAINEICGARWQVISTGGGAFLDPSNRQLLRDSNLVVHLRIRPETVVERLRNSHGGRPRPLLQVPDPLAKVKEMMEQRKSAYAEADLALDVDERTTYSLAADIVHHWSSRRRASRRAALASAPVSA
jgi:shikimate kinase